MSDDIITYMGVPLEQCSRETLYEAIEQLMREQQDNLATLTKQRINRIFSGGKG